MAFLSRVGKLLKQTVSKHANSELSASRPSLFQAIRSMSSSSKIFVGGLSYNTDEMSLREAFSQYGEVVEARVISDRDTGRSRGFGFVTYASTEAASTAIQAFDGQDLHGRRIRVNYATERPRGGGFGGGFGPGGGGYGGQSGYGGGGRSGGQGGYGGGGYGGQGGYGGGGYGGGGYQGGGGAFGGGTQYSGGGGGFGGANDYPSGGGGPVQGGNVNYGGGADSVQGGDINYGGSADSALGGDVNSGNQIGFSSLLDKVPTNTNGDGQEPLDVDRDGINEEDSALDVLEENNRDDDDESKDYVNTRS